MALFGFLRYDMTVCELLNGYKIHEQNRWLYLQSKKVVTVGMLSNLHAIDAAWRDESNSTKRPVLEESTH